MKLQEFLNTLGGEAYEWDNFAIVPQPLQNGFNFVDKKRNIVCFIKLTSEEEFVFFHHQERVVVNDTEESN